MTISGLNLEDSTKRDERAFFLPNVSYQLSVKYVLIHNLIKQVDRNLLSI